MKNYCKNITFDIIKIRANINYNNLNFYIYMNEMIIKLNIIFGIYNKITKSDIEFHDLNFDINLKEKKKIFEIFYTRFNAAIVLLNYFNILKISNLKRLINTRLKYRILKKNFFTYKKFMTRLRYITTNFETIDKTIFNKNNKNENNQKSENVFNQK